MERCRPGRAGRGLGGRGMRTRCGYRSVGIGRRSREYGSWDARTLAQQEKKEKKGEGGLCVTAHGRACGRVGGGKGGQWLQRNVPVKGALEICAFRSASGLGLANSLGPCLPRRLPPPLRFVSQSIKITHVRSPQQARTRTPTYLQVQVHTRAQRWCARPLVRRVYDMGYDMAGGVCGGLGNVGCQDEAEELGRRRRRRGGR